MQFPRINLSASAPRLVDSLSVCPWGQVIFWKPIGSPVARPRKPPDVISALMWRHQRCTRGQRRWLACPDSIACENIWSWRLTMFALRVGGGDPEDNEKLYYCPPGAFLQQGSFP